MRTSAGWVSILAVTLPICGCDVLESDPGLSVSVTMSPATFSVGEATEVVVVVTNTTDRERVVSGGGCMMSFRVFDSSGTLVAPYGDFVCAAARVFYTIPAGQSIEDRREWRGRTGLIEGDPLPPGEYEVVGHLDAVEIDIQSPRATIQLWSAPDPQ